jgi:hypothetical protein
MRVVSATRKIEAEQFVKNLSVKALADNYSIIRETNNTVIGDVIQIYDGENRLVGQYTYDQVETMHSAISTINSSPAKSLGLEEGVERHTVALHEQIKPLIDPRPVVMRNDTLLIYNYMSDELFLYDIENDAAQNILDLDLSDALLNVPRPWSVSNDTKTGKGENKYEIVSATLDQSGTLSMVAYVKVYKRDTSYTDGTCQVVKTYNHLPLYCKIVLSTEKLVEYLFLPWQFDDDIYPLYKNCIVMNQKIYLSEPFYYSDVVDYSKIQRLYVYDLAMNQSYSYEVPLECSRNANLGTNCLSLNIVPTPNEIYVLSSLDAYIYDAVKKNRYDIDTEYFKHPCASFNGLEDLISTYAPTIEQRAFSVSMISVNTGLVGLTDDLIAISHYVAGIDADTGRANIIIYNISNRSVERSFTEPSQSEYRLIRGSGKDEICCLSMKDDVYYVIKYSNYSIEE